jgi:hypothetical protein
LVWDIENTPQAIWAWGSYKQNAIGILRPWYMLSIAYKWLGEDEIHFTSIFDDDTFRPDPGWGKPRKNQDRLLTARAWHLLDLADVVIAHNGDKHDQRKAAARMMVHGLTPPSSYNQIDTLKEVKRYANFASNKLTDLGHALGIGQKVKHFGMSTWFGCMAGDPDQWRLMQLYNERDIELLEELYYELMPWIGSIGRTNPGGNAAAYDGKPNQCVRVGCGGEYIGNGYTTPTAAGAVYKRWRCKRCGGSSKSRFKERDYGQQPTIK